MYLELVHSLLPNLLLMSLCGKNNKPTIIEEKVFGEQVKYAFSILLLLSLIGCDMSDEISSLGKAGDVEKVWIYAQFNVP